MMRLALVTAAVVAITGTAFAQGAAPAVTPAKGDPARGRTVFARCAACHDLSTGANRLGPSLKGIIGRTSGTAPGFVYSQAMKDKAVVWNTATLDAYLAAPALYVPGNRMAYPPMANGQDRADLIAFLEQSAR